MSDLFLDIETVPDLDAAEYLEAKKRMDAGQLTAESQDKDLYWRMRTGALSPFTGKIALITYQIDDSYTHRLKEWEDGEYAILRRFYDLLVNLQRHTSADMLHIIGHNILGFDLFFLYDRMRRHSIAEERWIHHWLMKKPMVLDFLQMHLPLNNLAARGLRHDVLTDAYGIPMKGTSGAEEIQHYFEGRYDKILEYSEREFVYPELYRKIRDDGLVASNLLQETILRHEEMRSAA